MTPFIFLALGLLLILMEFYLPGAVMGIAGGILVITSIVLFAKQTSSILLVLLYILGTIIAIALLVKFALWKIKSAKPSRSIYLKSDQAGFQASSYDESAIGKKGVVLTDLKPGGHILIEGKRLQALSQGGYITKGTEVIVVGGQEESLIVKQIKKDKDS